MVSFAPLVPLGRLHKRKFQHLFRDRWSQACHPRDLHIPLGEWFQESTSQWARLNGSLRGFLLRFLPPPHASPLPTPGTPVHRRVSGGVGGTCGPPHRLRPLAGAPDVLSHQSSGTGGCLSGTQAVSPLSGRQESPPPHGQHDGGMLYQQAGGSPFSASLAENRGASSVVHRAVQSVVSPVCSGQVEHCSRPPQSTTHGPAVGMDSRARSAQASLVSLVHTSHRPLCHSVQSSPAGVCVPSSRPGSLGSGRPVHSLVKSPLLCHPTDSHHKESSQKGKRRKGHPHSDGPSLASPGMCPASGGRLQGHSVRSSGPAVHLGLLHPFSFLIFQTLNR